MNRRTWVVLAALVSVVGTPVASRAGDGAVETALQRVLGANRRLRDYATFITERGEAAALVLFVTDAIDPPRDATLKVDELTCPEMVQGIALAGTYHVGLVRQGKLINEVVIPDVGAPGQPRPVALPLRNTAHWNYEFWGAGSPTDSRKIEPTKLIKLADFNEDGHAWEFRLVEHGNCSDRITLLAGYSATRRRAIIFPILEHGHREYWEDNVFPSPNKPNARHVRRVLPCGDHGAEVEEVTAFAYDQRQEAWVLTGKHEKKCP